AQALARRQLVQSGAQTLIGRDTTRHHEHIGRGALARNAERCPRAIHDGLDDGLLERRAEIGYGLIIERGNGLRSNAHGCLETSKGKMRLGPAQHRARQGEAVSTTAKRGLLHGWSTGLRETEQLGRLVDGLAERIIDRGAETHVLTHALDQKELRMPAGDEQQDIRLPRALGLAVREYVRLDMVHANEWQSVDERNGIGLG